MCAASTRRIPRYSPGSRPSVQGGVPGYGRVPAQILYRCSGGDAVSPPVFMPALADDVM